MRERVGLMDLSTFSKFDVKGPDAYAFLDRICANKIPAKDGGIILGHLLNENGFIESEITVTRLAPDHFYVLSAAVAQLHDMDQLSWRKRDGEQRDDHRHHRRLSACWCWPGPRRAMCWRPAPRPISPTRPSAGSPARRSRSRALPACALLRVNYVGELGWELHVPMARHAERVRCR